jgi:hypothetical protein
MKNSANYTKRGNLRSVVMLVLVASAVGTMLIGCGGSSNRQDTRQDTRVESRTEDRVEDRRD